ncbi:Coiled-coil domain-containing protein 60 [Acropora cervicornis]|uniref:Coiled-coil domain-containing protein 60 n=1 Tax=Acropora cervicornis TaxID=6130 RepID=A0AAD9V3L5_ACRCE|nr:Coiled-coil domain-containing protein 60 [Acropora cervicornis]
MSLETFNNIYKALDQMRSSSIVADTETNEEMRQRVTEECKWYKDLLGNLPQDVKHDRYCTLEGRKISSSQFLKVLSTMRVWEICAPDINAAIEFVREKVVEMSELEFEAWLNAKFPQPSRPASAPLPKTSTFRY